MSKPKPKKYLESIKPYKGGVSKVDGIDKIFKLSSNENPFGSSLLAIEEYKKVSEELSKNESKIVEELNGAQGNAVDIGGYFQPDQEKVSKAMRPSETFNSILKTLL